MSVAVNLLYWLLYWKPVLVAVLETSTGCCTGNQYWLLYWKPVLVAVLETAVQQPAV
jgi:hypothetical protein